MTSSIFLCVSPDIRPSVVRYSGCALLEESVASMKDFHSERMVEGEPPRIISVWILCFDPEPVSFLLKVTC